MKENTKTLVITSKDIGLEVIADITKYMVMSRDQNAGRGHNTHIDNSSFEKVEDFKYLGATLTVLFRKKFRAHLSQEMIAIILRRMFCLSVCFQKYKD